MFQKQMSNIQTAIDHQVDQVAQISMGTQNVQNIIQNNQGGNCNRYTSTRCDCGNCGNQKNWLNTNRNQANNCTQNNWAHLHKHRSHSSSQIKNIFKGQH